MTWQEPELEPRSCREQGWGAQGPPERGWGWGAQGPPGWGQGAQGPPERGAGTGLGGAGTGLRGPGGVWSLLGHLLPGASTSPRDRGAPGALGWKLGLRISNYCAQIHRALRLQSSRYK